MRKAPRVSVEVLHHFSCGTCRKWWTIGDIDEEKTEWFCPWCGKVNSFEQENKKRD